MKYFSLLHRIIGFLALLPLAALPLRAQKSISGEINSFVWVTHVDYCTNTIVISDPTFARRGMQAVLIQMQGATIDSSDAPTFGEIRSFNNAGSYEVVTVRRAIGESVTLEAPLRNRYDSAGRVQLVAMPRYRDVTVTDILTTRSWDGSVGGVLAFEVEGTLTLEADIDVDGKGFRGGRPSAYRDAGADSSWVQPYERGIGGEKGEGIARPIDRWESARGAIANGGGGGNDVNGGGGGGGNGSWGGKGGGDGGWGYDLPVGGMGGRGLTAGIDSGRIFLGGGGGGGQQNNGRATQGARGGGIVLIIAKQIVGRGHRISASGDSAFPSGIDGGGGGGAGGSIVIHTGSFSGPLILSARGGNGANNHSDEQEWIWHPPGGGGGGGVVITTGASVTSSIRLELAGGKEGRIINDNSESYGEAFNAKPGGPGTYRAGLPLQRNSEPFVPITMDAGPDFTICAGWPGERIGARGIGGIAPYTYRWFPSNGLSSDTAAAPVASPGRTTTYYCEIVDARGCRSIDSVTVDVVDTPVRLLSELKEGSLEIDTTLLHSVRCSDIVLENNGLEPVTIPSATLGRNIEFSIPPSQLPLVIPPGERRTLRFCYEPKGLRIDTDTLSFDLDCRHRLPLKARGAIGLLTGDDECGNDVVVHIIADTLLRLQVSVPHPNPTGGIISISTIETRPAGSASRMEGCILYDHSGRPVATGLYVPRYRGMREGAIDESGSFVIDCSALPSGLYHIGIRTGGEIRSWPVVVTR